MSKGSSNPRPQSTVQNTGSLPPYAAPYFNDLLGRTASVSRREYTPYPNQRLAEFSDDTEKSFDLLRANANSPMPEEFGQAAGIFRDVGDTQQEMYGPTATITPNENIGSFIDEGVAEQYMNPYITNVLDAQHARLDQRFDEDQLKREAYAAEQGAFSNSRRGIVDAIAQRELAMQRNELDAAGMSAAYQSAGQMFDQERAADLQNRGLTYNVLSSNRDADLQNRGLNAEIFAANQNRRLSAAQGLGGIGSLSDAMEVQRAMNVAGIGAAQDARTQYGLDMEYEDFVRQRDWETQQLSDYSGILHGVPVTPQTTSTTYAPPPNRTSQVLGLGTAGLGLANAIMQVGDQAGG
jgi:hypothetical protein